MNRKGLLLSGIGSRIHLLTHPFSSFPLVTPTAARRARSQRRLKPPEALRLAGAATLILTAGALAGLAFLRAADERYVASIQQDLERSPATGETFSSAMVAGLPEPARRYLLHTIRPGTPLATRVYLSQAGSLRLGMRWVPFAAEQVLTAHGLVWRATTRLGPLPIIATDHVAHGKGRMRIAAFGLVPVINEAGPDLSRSTIGRLALEYIWLPSAWLPVLRPGVTVEPLDANRFSVTVGVDGETARLEHTVDRDGRLTDISVLRFGNITPDQHYQYIPFGVLVDEENTFGGYTIPTRIRAGWWYGTEHYQEDFRYQITAATFA